MAGSIEKRGENTYRLVVSGGKNLDGTRYKKTKTIHGTRTDAEIALAEFITEVNRGLVPEGKSITFEEFFYIWDEKYASKELAPKTYSRYIGILKSRILPYLGSFPLDKIKPTDLMNFYDMLENDTQIRRIAKNNGQITLKPLSPKTILEHHRLISAMLQNAVYWQLLPSNPARRVKPPKTKKTKMEFFNDNECKFLIQSLMELTGSKLKYTAAFFLLLCNILFILYFINISLLFIIMFSSIFRNSNKFFSSSTNIFIILCSKFSILSIVLNLSSNSFIEFWIYIILP